MVKKVCDDVVMFFGVVIGVSFCISEECVIFYVGVDYACFHHRCESAKHNPKRFEYVITKVAHTIILGTI